MPDLSFVIPVYNEEASLERLYAELTAAAAPLKLSYEVVLTDDASTDRSWSILQQLAQRDPRWRAQRFAYNCGESAASAAGMKAAGGDIIITLDADLQNDPADLPAFLRALENADCVCGSRVHHRADHWVRRLSSRIANAVRNRLSGESISDAGCTYRAFRRSMLAEVKFFRGAHRFLPTLFRMEGYRVVEIPITPRERFAGYSKYSIGNRVFKSFADLLAVRWMKSRRLNYRVAETTRR
ncbi:MAG: glycosyltransferase family 2 protein [Verrucomicrobiales bacterium]|jgi:glycosyltransferase involved in cell wall biosynthesis|nr:glycosyltransferase family 2 protein [Verrucomicrobiales bacterium]